MYFNWGLITSQYCSGFCHIDLNQPWVVQFLPYRTTLREMGWGEGGEGFGFIFIDHNSYTMDE